MSDDFDSPSSHGPRRDAATCLALVGVLFVASALLALVALVLPQVRALFLVGGGLLFLIGFHYITWGWWLSRSPTPEEDEAEQTS
jgi:hypothetical protein